MHPFVIIPIYIRDLCPFLCLLNEFNSIETSALNLYWEAAEVEGIFSGISLPWPQRSGSALRSSTPEASGHRWVRNLFLLRGRKTEVQCFFFWEYCSWTSIRKQVWPHPTCQWQGQTCAELSMMRLAILDSCCSWATIITIITRAINTSILQRVYSSHCSPKNVHEISGCFKQAKEIF